MTLSRPWWLPALYWTTLLVWTSVHHKRGKACRTHGVPCHLHSRRLVISWRGLPRPAPPPDTPQCSKSITVQRVPSGRCTRWPVGYSTERSNTAARKGERTWMDKWRLPVTFCDRVPNEHSFGSVSFGIPHAGCASSASCSWSCSRTSTAAWAGRPSRSRSSAAPS